jgi:hypothetical protein
MNRLFTEFSPCKNVKNEILGNKINKICTFETSIVHNVFWTETAIVNKLAL